MAKANKSDDKKKAAKPAAKIVVPKRDIYTKDWIISNSIPIIRSYGTSLTIRALHYRLVAKGMINDINHYKRVVSAITDARWDSKVRFNAFVDHERETHGTTDYEETVVEDKADHAKDQIKLWATSYSKNRWENQPIYPEVFIEKKALQGVFERPCSQWNVALSPCKGYPSLTFQYEMKQRFDKAIRQGKEPVILYFGDYDCSGEDIPRSIGDTLSRMGVDVEVRRIALMEAQVIEWDLPPAPTKTTDTRAAAWDGQGQVELDAVMPEQIQELLEEALQAVFDEDLHDELMAQEDTEKEEFKAILKRDFDSLLNDEE